MFRIAGFSGVAAALLVAVAASLSFILLGGGASYAFGDVIENVKKAKAVIFNLKSKIGPGPEMEMTWYMQGDRVRMEMGNFQIKIADLKKGKGLDLIPRFKTAQFFPIGKKVAGAFDNPILQLRRLKPKDAKKIGREKKNGKFADVYLVNKVDLFGMKGEGEMKIWVDPKTQMPVRLRMACNTRKGAKGKPYDTYLIIENISWHESLDPRLFRLTPPKGYKEMTNDE